MPVIAQRRVVGAQQFVGFQAKVGGRVAGNEAPAERDAGSLAHRGGHYFQRIRPGQGQEHLFEPVEPIGSAFGHVKTKIELGVGENEHNGA